MIDIRIFTSGNCSPAVGPVWFVTRWDRLGLVAIRRPVRTSFKVGHSEAGACAGALLLSADTRSMRCHEHWHPRERRIGAIPFYTVAVR